MFRAAQVQGWRSYGLQTEGLAVGRGVHGPHALKVCIHTSCLYFSTAVLLDLKL